MIEGVTSGSNIVSFTEIKKDLNRIRSILYSAKGEWPNWLTNVRDFAVRMDVQAKIGDTFNDPLKVVPKFCNNQFVSHLARVVGYPTDHVLR